MSNKQKNIERMIKRFRNFVANPTATNYDSLNMALITHKFEKTDTDSCLNDGHNVILLPERIN